MRRDNVKLRISKRRRRSRRTLILKRTRSRAPISGLVFTPAEEPVWRKTPDSVGISAMVLLDEKKKLFQFPFRVSLICSIRDILLVLVIECEYWMDCVGWKYIESSMTAQSLRNIMNGCIQLFSNTRHIYVAVRTMEVKSIKWQLPVMA